MKRTPGGGGRQKRVTGGGGNVFRRGEGLGGGSRGQGPGRASGSASGLIPLILGLLLGNLGSGGGKKKGSCLKRLIVLIIIIVIASMVFRCMFGGAPMEQDYDAGYTQQAAATPGLNIIEEEQPAPAAPTAPTEAGAANLSVSNLSRGKYTEILGNGRDVYTIMVYMCGTDLESNYGMATADLNEMLHADLGENVNIIVETGGTKEWQNTVISNRVNQRYQVKNDGLVRLKSDLGKRSMVKPETLTDFITYCAEEFPANRYALIMWDHGGGSNTGYGYDQHFAGSSMTLDLFNQALREAGVKFDFIGFDACLMATLETALVCEQYADYLIASEETEPGCGWYYTNWLTELSEDTSLPTVEMGKRIIDDFTTECRKQSAMNQTTLSIVDLAELKGTVPEAFGEFAASTVELIDSDEYKQVSNARSSAKEFSSGINQIDLIHFAENLGTPEAEALAEALRGCIKYNRVSRSLANANGISIYFPYNKLSSMNSMVDTYEKIGMDDGYIECIRSFASLSAGGQLTSSSTGSPLASLFGDMSGSGNSADMLGTLLSSAVSGSGGGYSTGNSYADLMLALAGSSWLDTGRALDNQAYYAANSLDASRLTATEKGGSQVLKLTDEEWELIQEIELNVYADDGEGFINLGLDNTYTFDDDLDLVMDYDGTWLAIDGQVVSYHMLSHDIDGDTYVITGRVPALLNGERVNLILVFTDENPYGSVAGAQTDYSAGETETVMRGLIELQDGDEIDFLCDYYSYDGEYQDTYMLGNRLTVSGEPFISNVTIGDMNARVTYRLTDIYGNHYWTEALEY